MRNDLTEFLTPPRRAPAADAARHVARDSGRLRDTAGSGMSGREASRQEISRQEISRQEISRPEIARQETSRKDAPRNDDARPRFTLPEQPGRPEAARGVTRSATSPAALMRGQGADTEHVAASGKTPPAIGLNAILRGLSGEAALSLEEALSAKGTLSEKEALAVEEAPAGEADSESVGEASGDGEADAQDAVPEEADAAIAAMRAALAEQAASEEEEPSAEAGPEGDNAGDAASPVAAEAVIAKAADADAGDAGETEGDAASDAEGAEAEPIAATASRADARNDIDAADEASRASRGERGPVAAHPVAGDASRAAQANGAGNSAAGKSAAGQSAASQSAAGQPAAAGDAATADGEGDPEGDGEGPGDDAQSETRARTGRGAGEENRSAVAQEALRRALGGEAGAGRAALAPGEGDQAARHTAEQVARMMQAGAEGVSIQAKGAAQAAAEATTTANGQASTASQAGTAAPQVNGSVLINTPLSAVPMTLGMKAMGGASRFEIRLDPAELGRIAVSLDIDDEGTVKARLVVDRVETLQLLQRDARTLERAFEQAGLKPSEDGIDLSLRDDGDRPTGDGEDDAQEGRATGDGRGRDGDESEKGLAAAEIRALARETLLARQALRRALGGVDLSI